MQKHVPTALVTTLLSSCHHETLSLALQALAEAAVLVPSVVPVDTIPRLLQLLCVHNYGEGLLTSAGHLVQASSEALFAIAAAEADGCIVPQVVQSIWAAIECNRG